MKTSLKNLLLVLFILIQPLVISAQNQRMLDKLIMKKVHKECDSSNFENCYKILSLYKNGCSELNPEFLYLKIKVLDSLVSKENAKAEYTSKLIDYCGCFLENFDVSGIRSKCRYKEVFTIWYDKVSKKDTSLYSSTFNRVRVLSLNFKEKSFSGLEQLEKLRQGDLYRLKIDSINMNLYKIILDKKDTIISSDVTFPTFDLVNLGGVDELLNKLLNKAFAQSISEPLMPSDSGLYSDVYGSIIVYKDTLDSINREISTIKYAVDSLTLEIRKKMISYAVESSGANHYQKLSKDIKLDSIIIRIDTLRKNLRTSMISISELATKYDKYAAGQGIKDTIRGDSTLKKTDKDLRTLFAESISFAEKLYENINAGKVSAWIEALVYKENNAGFTYLSLPQQLNGDRAMLTISIVPQDEKSGLQSYHTVLHFPQKKPFYVGAGMSFYASGLTSPAYSVSATAIDSTRTDYRIVEEDGVKTEVGVTALLHFGWKPLYRRADWWSLNMVTGPALSLSNPVKPRIVIGGGTAFGRKSMLSVNALYVYGPVDKISNVYSVNGIYNVQPENVTVSTWKGTWGVSLGYIYKF